MASFRSKSLIATAAIFCCRFTGLLREVVYTGLFGATGALDAFLTAFRVPNMLRDMFAEGALSQSFTSVMSKAEQTNGREAAWQMAHRVSAQLLSLMLCIVAAGVLLAGVCMQYLYPQRALLELELTEPSAAAVESVSARYRGMHKSADGLAVCSFEVAQPLAGATAESCIRVQTLEKLQPGQEVQLSFRSMPGELRVEERSYLGLATDLCRIMWPFILLASLSALCMGALNVFGIFGLPNLASAAFNITTISVGFGLGWLIDPQFGPRALYGFAVAVVLGGVAQVLVQLPKLRRNGYRLHWDIGLTWRGGKGLPTFTDERVRLVWRLMVPGAIAAGITQTNVFINTSFALYLPGGAVTALSCAFHLWQLPVALFGVAVGMVVLPTVSRMAVSRGNSEIAQQLAVAMRFVAFFAVPSAVVLGLWGEEIVSVFFQRGRFDAAASALTGQVLAAYSLGLLGYAGMKVLQPVFMALERPWAPAGLALGACALSIGLNYTFVHVLGLGASWLAFTTACVTTLNFLFFFFYLRHLLGCMACGTLLPGLLRICLAGLVLAAFCYYAHTSWLSGLSAAPFFTRLSTLGLSAAAAGILYLLAATLLRVPELSFFLSKLHRRPRS